MLYFLIYFPSVVCFFLKPKALKLSSIFATQLCVTSSHKINDKSLTKPKLLNTGSINYVQRHQITTYAQFNTNNIANIEDCSINAKDIDPYDPYTFGFVEMGEILGPHGIQGELKMHLEADFADQRLVAGSIIYVKKLNRRSPRAVKVINSRKQANNIYLVRLEHVFTRQSTGAFKQCSVYAKLQDRPPLNSNEYLIRDIVGMGCYFTKDYDLVKGTQKEKFRQKMDTVCETNEKMAAYGKFVDGVKNIALPFGKVVDVAHPNDICNGQEDISKLMHALLEIKIYSYPVSIGEFYDDNIGKFCLVPLVPAIVTDVDVAMNRLFVDPPKGLLELTYNRKAKKIVIFGYLTAPKIIESPTKI